MRARGINMGDLLADGDTNTLVVEGYRVDEAELLFAAYGRLRQHN
jgi:hypothetical protein